jgi:hypothetical protein
MNIVPIPVGWRTLGENTLRWNDFGETERRFDNLNPSAANSLQCRATNRHLPGF